MPRIYRRFSQLPDMKEKEFMPLLLASISGKTESWGSNRRRELLAVTFRRNPLP